MKQSSASGIPTILRSNSARLCARMRSSHLPQMPATSPHDADAALTMAESNRFPHPCGAAVGSVVSCDAALPMMRQNPFPHPGGAAVGSVGGAAAGAIDGGDGDTPLPMTRHRSEELKRSPGDSSYAKLWSTGGPSTGGPSTGGPSTGGPSTGGPGPVAEAQERSNGPAGHSGGGGSSSGASWGAPAGVQQQQHPRSNPRPYASAAASGGVFDAGVDGASDGTFGGADAGMPAGEHTCAFICLWLHSRVYSSL